jgi:hypothetical protein
MAKQKQKKGIRSAVVERDTKLTISYNREAFLRSLESLGFHIGDFNEDEQLRMLMHSVKFVDFTEAQVKELVDNIGRLDG